MSRFVFWRICAVVAVSVLFSPNFDLAFGGSGMSRPTGVQGGPVNRLDQNAAVQQLKTRARAGDPQAQAEYGYLLDTGKWGTNRNLRQAVALFKQAATAGNSLGLALLGFAMERQVVAGPVVSSRVTADSINQSYIDAAEKNDALGKALRGYALLRGLGEIPRNEAEAVRFFQESAAQDNKVGKALLGYAWAMRFGGLVGESEEVADAEALRLLRDSASGKYGFGQAFLGWAHETGRLGLKQNYKEAVKHYQRSADQGNPRGLALLGNAYERGLGGLRQDQHRAVEFYEKAAHQFDPLGQAFLGNAYERGIGGLVQDFVKAVELYRASSNAGEPRGDALLGSAMRKGIGGLKRDYAGALAFFQKAANKKDPLGQAYLGHGYIDGVGVKQDEHEGARLLQAGAAQGNPYAMALLSYGLSDGLWGLEEDRFRAQQLVETSFDQGDPLGIVAMAEWENEDGTIRRPADNLHALLVKAGRENEPLAFQRLAEIHWDGLYGIPRNTKTGDQYSIQAADLGDVQSLCDAGQAHFYDDGIVRDYARALQYFQEGADLGRFSCMAYLGKLYEMGEGGLVKDEARAVTLYQRALEGGSLDGQYFLGVAYAKGIGGLKVDREEARKLLLAAKDRGHDLAQQALIDVLAPQFSKDITISIKDECPACLESFEGSKEQIVLLPCGHAFHRDCADQWEKPEDREKGCMTCRQ